MIVRTEILVVGAGPAGLTAARVAAQRGARVLVLERRPRAGTSSCCTGLVSPDTLAVLNVSDRCVLREIRAVRVHSPGGVSVSLRAPSVKAIVVDRQILEMEILKQALDAGVDVRFGRDVTAASPERFSVRTACAQATACTVCFIGADGPQSRMARWFGLDSPRPLVHAAQAEVVAPTTDRDSVDVFLGNRVAPGFFAWHVPAQDGVIRVGVGVLPPHHPRPYLDALLGRQFPDRSVLRRSAGFIPLARAPIPAAPGLLLVGDAAGHVKPLSGGGLHMGGLCAAIAGRIAADLVDRPARKREMASQYVSDCLDAIGREQAFGKTLRHYAAYMTDDDLDRVARAADDPALLGFLAEHVQIDVLHQLPDRLATEPVLWGALLRLIPLAGLFAQPTPSADHP